MFATRWDSRERPRSVVWRFILAAFYPRRNMRATKAEDADKFLTTDKDWDTTDWTPHDLAIASDALVKIFLTDTSDLADKRRDISIYLLSVLLKRHPEFMLPYLERLCETMMEKGLRVPNFSTATPEVVPLRLMAALTPMTVRCDQWLQCWLVCLMACCGGDRVHRLTSTSAAWQ